MKNQQAVVELKSPSRGAACRFCATTLPEGGGLASLSACGLRDVCEACVSLGQNTCLKIHTCGHACNGFRDESICLPCLHGGCPEHVGVSQDRDDECMICYSGCLAEGPCLRLRCGHVFHGDCLRRRITVGYPGARIDFKFCRCPICMCVGALLFCVYVLFLMILQGHIAG
jgi:E3 ubiquitin-protein ligase MYCBP2